MTWKTFFLLSFSAWLFYTLYVPLPSEVEDKAFTHFINIQFAASYFIGKTCEFFGISTVLHVRRSLEGLLSRGQMLVWGKKYDAMEIVSVLIEADSLEADQIEGRIYYPNGRKGVSGEEGLILFVHGGGWRHLSIDFYEDHTRRLSHESQNIVIALGYRQAPEYPYPTPLRDVLASVRHFVEKHQHYGINPQNASITMMGDSCGGNLAIAASLLLAKELVFDAHVLVYPATQMENLQTESYRKNTPITPFFINSYTMAEIHGDYIFGPQNSKEKTNLLHSASNSSLYRDVFGKYLMDPFLNPLGAADESGFFNEVFIAAAEFDVLRDDAFLYHHKLTLKGVHSTLKTYPGIHGIMLMDSYVPTSAGDRLFKDVLKFIGKQKKNSK